ncbi:glycosyltransferase family 2 protein [Loigolactobacillus binensis]|uniref:Glycosyltransferase family 2 protein n=1 Tax=Loigolactobacillus binensis TaxID=2559922 RepID=A0ABW3EG54_9LACO|nr:glycosyltransferase [Loigolactobacillus binensis]
MQLTAVVVFYQTELAAAPTLQSLQQAITPALQPFLAHIHFVLYDNSPHAHTTAALTWLPDFEYQHDPRNLGIATAYNAGLQVAKQKQSQYLWLLDQDTQLTAAFLTELQQQLPTTTAQAIVPQIEASGVRMSPRDIRSPFKVVPLASGLQRHVLAINSAALLQVAFLHQLGGFSAAFQLDFLDNWLFYQLDQQQGTVQVLPSVLHHQLSVMNTQQIKMPRYRSIITAEWRYYHQYQKISEWHYRGHLLLRFASQLLLKRDFTKASYLLKFIFGRRPE